MAPDAPWRASWLSSGKLYLVYCGCAVPCYPYLSPLSAVAAERARALGQTPPLATPPGQAAERTETEGRGSSAVLSGRELRAIRGAQSKNYRLLTNTAHTPIPIEAPPHDTLLALAHPSRPFPHKQRILDLTFFSYPPARSSLSLSHHLFGLSSINW